MHCSARLLAFTATLALTGTGAHAAVTISSGATANMSCASGVCAPTAKSAVLNVGDLEGFLASGNLTVTTTGSGVQADDIHVNSALTWSNSSTLSLQAHRSVAINAAVSITGLSGLTLDTGKNGTLSFGKKGNATFANLSSQLTINGSAYTLVSDIKTLAGAIAGNPSGSFALAANFDASQDGTYTSAPIPTPFAGTFEGLGHVISNLTIDDESEFDNVGLFAGIGAAGSVRDIELSQANVTAVDGSVGGFAGYSEGTITNAACIECAVTDRDGGSAYGEAGGLIGMFGSDKPTGLIVHSYTSGSVTCASGEENAVAGGLVGGAGYDSGTILESHSSAKVTGATAGGLVGVNGSYYGGAGTVAESYATGTVYGVYAAGGLAGGNGQYGTIDNSYATGAVSTFFNDGGFAGGSSGSIEYSYSTGRVSRGEELRGGFVSDGRGGTMGFDYWDTDTSHVRNLKFGAGQPHNDPGISGLSTQQLQSGLPAGFDPAIWSENPNINGGLPYLLDNPPPK